MPVSVEMLLHTIDRPSFNAEKPVLVNIVADFTNSSRSDVDLTILFGRKPRMRGRNINRILLYAKPRDRRHEKYIVSKMNLSIALRDEINWRMQNETTENKINVINIGPIIRSSPGQLNHVKVF